MEIASAIRPAAKILRPNSGPGRKLAPLAAIASTGRAEAAVVPVAPPGAASIRG